MLIESNYNPGLTHPDSGPLWKKFNNQSVAATAKSITAGVTPKAISTSLAIIHSDDANSVDITIGPDTDCNQQTLGPGSNFIVEAGGIPSDLQHWFFKSASSGQTIRVAYV